VKLLVSPLVWYLLAVLIGVLLLRGSADGNHRRIANGLIFVTLLVAFSSTPLVGILLERSLRVDRVHVSGSTPEIIIVLGGGDTPSTSPEEDVLSIASTQRIRHAVAEWQLNTNARLVLSGATSLGGGRPGRPPHPAFVELMAQVAVSYGVHDSVLVLEPHSTNTREHPIEVLRLPGVTPTTHVAVVTSGWHMRRARAEFCRHFERVDLLPVPPIEHSGAPRSLLPQARTLSRNTTLLREWFGIIWYAIRRIGAEPVGNCKTS
jgi:uncharacterized SAM-binding protein YcdF (DUF218 family)